ncbi:MAG TPA: bifunctional glutamate N-acetyltransferase/amino-acid acetyltransferase ArgJ [Megamonas hypermegale]|jgi:glutamate N-acetyltransferase/amino-acid N-acetyltransferase|uniref:Arginine biosynthesis bifunctional protein ArgJ n=2 Tax=Bacillati TaxID=1783272 RepID=A0A239TZ35_9FIRM|nr:bifunctional glutamate N-acetyltransferase/amino-acid acetyltransferase ArgJ [Megamonas hypermegale]MBM6760141.1 bifunctional glutamate N-acetyltransferase/amino-acid acetyltransferase ArgJ [Megamonas hypermegale]SNV01993.1 Arginine biosynthesis bifunctional protein ArgJ [Megamonas hypermegale]HJG06828.1 bifunctional glutamate N-acetyltransferase/amino-acid acetyltransferase ArgJ [Megamonas hypermegale]
MIKKDTQGVTYAKGFKAAGVKAGIKKSGNLDVAVIYTETPAAIAGTFTQNKVAAAPVYVSKETVATGSARAIVANAGCANACTGKQGMDDAYKTREIAAKELGINADDVIVGSTGVIGVTLPMDKLEKGIKDAVADLSETGSINAANAIITTDTHCKTMTVKFDIGDAEVHMGAIAKGSGMIRPNMATMLCYITTDLDIEQSLLQKALSTCVEKSFNMISVDGDMSTNDTVVVLANGLAGNKKITEENADYDIFCSNLMALCVELAKEIAADGEGASKFLTINVKGAKSFADAKTVGMAVANSPLVKTAFFGEDPNWGRVICAVGYSGADMVPEKTVVKFGGITIFDCGVGAQYDSEALVKVMRENDIVIDIELNLGDSDATVWTCDLSYEYVKINGEYHT